MFQGIRSNGSEILPTYADLTIEIKKLKGQPTDRVTLFDTGSFYQKIKTNVSGQLVITDSEDEKSEKLKKKYGKRIFGLSENYRSEYLRETLNPKFLASIKASLQL